MMGCSMLKLGQSVGANCRKLHYADFMLAFSLFLRIQSGSCTVSPKPSSLYQGNFADISSFTYSIFASFNDTFVHITDLTGKETISRVTGASFSKCEDMHCN